MAKTILLADDSITIQKVVELTFMDEDYQIMAVSDGTAALAKLDENIPDLVIADVHMPGADGYEVCRTVKQRAPEVPVVLLVGTFEPFDADQAASANADGHLKKPFDSQDLLQLVEQLIGSEATAEEQAAEEPAVAESELPSPTFGAVDAAPSVGTEDETLIGSATDFALADGLGTPRIHALMDDAPSIPVVEVEAAAASEATTVAGGTWDGSQSVTEEAEEAIEDTNEAVLDAADSVVSAADDLDLELAGATGLTASAEDQVTELVASAPEADTRPTLARSMDTSEDTSEVAEESAASDNGHLTLSDSDLERVAKRVVELISDKVLHDVAWEVVPDLAELAIKERIRDLESQVE